MTGLGKIGDKELDLLTDSTGKTHLRRLYLEDSLNEAGKRLARQVEDRLDFILKTTQHVLLKAGLLRWEPNLMMPAELLLQLDQLLVGPTTPESTSILKLRTHEPVENFPQAFQFKVFSLKLEACGKNFSNEVCYLLKPFHLCPLAPNCALNTPQYSHSSPCYYLTIPTNFASSLPEI